MNPIENVLWKETSPELDEVLSKLEHITVHALNQGYEAEVHKIRLKDKDYLVKVWNKTSRPDVSVQYRLLNFLYKHGQAVSKPLGLGETTEGEMVLVCSFDGEPIGRVNETTMGEVARMLAKIHQIEHVDSSDILPTYNFVAYFFPGISRYKDLDEVLGRLLQEVIITQEHIIHGDYHLANILEKDGRFTIIDWTNGQMGDPRFDLSWSLLLLELYVSKKNADRFLQYYKLVRPFEQMEREVFEALAILRWTLLYRGGSVPITPTTITRIKSMVRNNPLMTVSKLV